MGWRDRLGCLAYTGGRQRPLPALGASCMLLICVVPTFSVTLGELPNCWKVHGREEIMMSWTFVRS